ncbi:MAG: hypothetical protein UT84_C0008G0005 [Candidatus Curtissbacteria bacterium GW2011_GWA1_40_16]|uniref:N-acetyltransferase domain-containing protein n=1 Tax=Candidatus Curtissbacteria bacterium GW2011_GWA1_40_16 TaxID=1618405 RepID=A0A0G0RLE6_9BACT|nr:MAG: hypothetical protein UT84_C0008G0005 [Candidatus Curtissbacteria bacterium GW2011_GWA1_40_16]
MAESQESEQPDQPSLKELTADSPAELKLRVNTFLNGLGKGNTYDWSDKRFDFMLRDSNYHTTYIEKDGQITAAIDYQVSENGTINTFRARTIPQESKGHFGKTGKTLGDELFDHMLKTNPSAKSLYAEVTPDGYKYLKRQVQRRGLAVVTNDQPNETGFGVIRINLNREQQAARARIQKLRVLKASLGKTQKPAA